jgi:hypothetical protein
MGRYLDLDSQSFLQKQGGIPTPAAQALRADATKVQPAPPRPMLCPGDGSTHPVMHALNPQTGICVRCAGAEKTQPAIVTTTPILRPGKPPRPFPVALDGSTCCPACGQAGKIPHHLSLLFWRFWTRSQLAALLEAMRPDERLAWLAKELVRVEGPGGQSRELREVSGRWNEVPK